MVKLRNLFSSIHFMTFFTCAFLITVFSYLILRTYHRRFDLSEGRVYSLSPQTIDVLTALHSEPIRISAFFREDDEGLKTMLEDLLKEYAYHHGNMRFEFFDPDRLPSKAKHFNIDSYGTIVIEAKNREERTKQVSEEALTNLLAKFLREEVKTIVFSKEHSEHPLDDHEDKYGYGLFRLKLIDSNYEVKETVLLREGIPKGTDLFVLGGPRIDLLPDELETIRRFLNSGGSVLILIDPVESGEGKNLQGFLLEYGVELTHDVVVDKLSKLFGVDYLIPFVTEYKPHPLTKGFRVGSFFPMARSVRKVAKAPANFEVTEVAWTGRGSWAETDLKTLADGKAEFDRKKDQEGPVPLSVAVSTGKRKGRLVVYGDSDFITNSYLNLAGNKDLALNTVAWLAREEFSITIRPRMRETAPLYLKETDQQFLFYGSVLGFPVVCVLTGGGVFFWRRRFH